MGHKHNPHVSTHTYIPHCRSLVSPMPSEHIERTSSGTLHPHCNLKADEGTERGL